MTQTHGRYRDANIAVIMGGLSREREVSLTTGKAIADALDGLGYAVIRIDAGRDLPIRLITHRIDVVYNALHGTYGEDGRVQGLLDYMGIPYTGEGLTASLFAFDKVLAKQRYRAAGLPVADDIVVEGDALQHFTLADLPFDLPVAVKPVADGSSVGVTLCHRPEQFATALTAAAPRVLIERLVRGIELSVAVMGDTLLGSVEIEPAREFYDYAAKYQNTGTRYHIPPRIDPELRAAAEAAALGAHRALGCRGATRTDVMIGAPDACHPGPIVIETNTLPGMTASSLLPKIAAAAGIPFPKLVERILDGARCEPADPTAKDPTTKAPTTETTPDRRDPISKENR